MDIDNRVKARQPKQKHWNAKQIQIKWNAMNWIEKKIKISSTMYRMNIWHVICLTKWLQRLIRSNQHSKFAIKVLVWYEKKETDLNDTKPTAQNIFKINAEKKIVIILIMAKSVFFPSTLLWWRHYLHTKREIHASRSANVYTLEH